MNFFSDSKFFISATVFLGLSPVFINLSATQVSASTFSIGTSTVAPATLTAPNPPGSFPPAVPFGFVATIPVTNTSTFKKIITSVEFDFEEDDILFDDLIARFIAPTFIKIFPGQTIPIPIGFTVTGAQLNPFLGGGEGLTLEFEIYQIMSKLF